MTNLYNVHRTEAQLDQALPNRRAAPLPILRTLFSRTAAAWGWLEQKRAGQLASKRLRVTETISLGEKRSVSILQVDGAQFLIGVGTGSISVLAVRGGQQDSDDVAWRQPSPREDA